MVLCAQGNATKVRARLPESDANRPETMSRGEVVLPLEMAATYGHLDVVKILVDEGGANVDGRLDHNSVPLINAIPLISASLAGYVDVITFLLSRGANVNLQGAERTTALFCACQYAIKNQARGGACSPSGRRRSRAPRGIWWLGILLHRMQGGERRLGAVASGARRQP